MNLSASSWLFWAVLSAMFAALTAIFAKVGVENVNSDLATFIRTLVVVAAVTMPLTYSIATGIGLGFITYVLCKIIAGKFAEARPAVVVLAILFGIKFAITG